MAPAFNVTVQQAGQVHDVNIVCTVINRNLNKNIDEIFYFLNPIQTRFIMQKVSHLVSSDLRCYVTSCN